MADKSIHIVFQVLNSLHDANSKAYKLLPVDKLILITLASHKGTQGIFPMQETLADEIGTSLRYMKTRLKFLEKNGFIFVEKINRKNHYHLLNLSTEGDLQITNEEIKGDPQITSQVIYRSPHRGSTDATNNKVSNKLNKIERGHASRASPLSDDFMPNKQSIMKAKELGLTEDEANFEFDKFMSYYQDTGEKKSNWQKALQLWFIRAIEYKEENGYEIKHEIVSTVRDYDPEPMIDCKASKEVAVKALGEILGKLKLNGKGGHHGNGLHGQMEEGKR